MRSDSWSLASGAQSRWVDPSWPRDCPLSPTYSGPVIMTPNLWNIVATDENSTGGSPDQPWRRRAWMYDAPQMRCFGLPCSSSEELVSIQCGVCKAHCSSSRICVLEKKPSKTRTRSRTRERSAVSGVEGSTRTERAIEELREDGAGEVLDPRRRGPHVP